MECIKKAAVLRNEKGDVILYPGRIYRLNTGKTVVDGCEFVSFDNVNENLFFRIDEIEVHVRVSKIVSVEEK